MNALKSMILDTPLERPARFMVQKARSIVLGHEDYDGQTVKVMRRVLRRDSNAIDVGCHIGTILKQILRFAPDGRHLAFEPIPHLHAALVRRFLKVDIHSHALSNRAGTTTFHFVEKEPWHSGIKLRSLQGDARVQTMDVPTARLDDLLNPRHRIDFIKIDVEGAELQVFEGAQRTLETYRPVVVFEHGLGGADLYGAAPEHVFDLLAGCNLRLFLLHDWLRGAAPLSRAAFSDQFYSRTNHYFLASS